MRAPLLLLTAAVVGCFAAKDEPPQPVYHNPLDFQDGGSPHHDGGGPTTPPNGTVDQRSPRLISATYRVEIDDAGQAATVLFIADVGNLCGADGSDAGLGLSWDLLRIRLNGDVPAIYPVAPILPPAGGTAEFDYQTDAGGFGTTPAQSGSIELDGVDPGNRQPALGSYTLTFNGTDQLSGDFTATPCALTPPAPGS